VRAETRHQLKQDRFSRATIEAAEATVHWTVEHKTKLILGSVVVVVVAAAILGTLYHLNLQDQEASAMLSQAVRTLDTAIRPEGSPPQPDVPSFTSSRDRATQAHRQFQEIVSQYPHTRSAAFARYFVGLTSSQLGDNATAERELKEVAASRNADLAALAKFALASVYRNTNHNKEAIDLYNQLISKPTRTVAKVTAQLEQAATYQSAQLPLEAKRVYEQVQKENPATEAAQMASAKLQEMK
jgi:tetratricopeptide (TPR) repeat protein